MTKRLYFLGGAEVECARDNSTGTWGIKPRTSVNLIMGYEVKENFLLETKANFQLNQTSWGAYGDAFVPTPAVYTIGGRWKF